MTQPALIVETTASLTRRIVAAHKGDARMAREWVVMQNVAETTGTAHRYADAIAMNLWPSRGLALHGFEVKVSRSDWLRELKNPAKADPIAQFCDFWWVVAPTGMIQPDELPAGWGLYEPNRGKALSAVRRATQREDARPITKAFAASMIRRAYDHAPSEAEMVEREATAAQRARTDAVATASRDARVEHDKYVGLLEAVTAFQEAAGIKLIEMHFSSLTKGWYGSPAGHFTSPEELGAAVRAALAGEDGIRRLAALRKDLMKIVELLPEEAIDVATR